MIHFYNHIKKTAAVLVLSCAACVLLLSSCSGGGGGGGGSGSSPSGSSDSENSNGWPTVYAPSSVTPPVTYTLSYELPAGAVTADDNVYLARVNLTETAFATTASTVALSDSLHRYAGSAYTGGGGMPLTLQFDSPTAYAMNASRLEAIRASYHPAPARSLLFNRFNEAGAKNTGDTEQFTILLAANETTDRPVKKNAVLKVKGTYANIWYVPGSTDVNGAPADETTINSICSQFAVKFDAIYNIERTVFGAELDCDDRGEPGVSTRVNIVLANLNDEYSGGYLGGYFWAADYFDPMLYYDVPSSNYGKFFYMDTAIALQDTATSYSILCHEFLHMIQFANKGLKCDDWFNEMLAMTAEDLLHPVFSGQPFVTDGKSFPVSSPEYHRIPRFAVRYYMSGITDWWSGDARGNSYCVAYTFGAYLFRNYGADLISVLSKSSEPGTLGLIKKTLGTALFNQMLRDYYKVLLPPYDRTDGPSVYKESSYGGYTLPKIKLDDVAALDNLPVTIFGPDDSLFDLRPYGIILQRISDGGNGSAGTVTVSNSAVKTCYLAVVHSDGSIDEYEPSVVN